MSTGVVYREHAQLESGWGVVVKAIRNADPRREILGARMGC